MKHGKKYRTVLNNLDRHQLYSLEDAVAFVKENASAKFNETVEISVNLGVDPRHAEQNIRVTTSLPYGTGKEVKVLVLAKGSAAKEAKDNGADFVGDDDFIQKLQGGWTDADVIIASPDMMPKVGRLGKILGPKGLMPNPKSGTVTPQVGDAVKEIKAGRIELRVDKYGVIHAPVGKCSFENEQLIENIKSVISMLRRLKPSAVKGTYLKKLTISSTMGPGVKINKTTV